MTIEPFSRERDEVHVRRIWEEVGWLDTSEENQVKGMDALLDAGRAWVSRMNDEAECLVMCSEGTIRYLDEDLPFSGVTAVTTSRVGRKQGLAGRLTAHAIAQEVKDGAAVSGLGMFEQGFYDRLGFGSGHCEQQIAFDPQMLKVPFQKRPPWRLTTDDYALMHQSRLDMFRHHGYCAFRDAGMTEVDRCNTEKGFGLGYVDESTGKLTHHVWFNIQDAENGPYDIRWMAFQNREQFLELMGVVRSLGDQVRKVTYIEAPHIQLQDLLNEPIQNRMTTQGGKFATSGHALAWWQTRINDVEACLKQTHIPGETIRFNLEVSDPIETYIPDDQEWRGAGGEYTITLGPESEAKRGTDSSLLTVKTTINAFTRFWLGNVSALGLNYTDTFDASDELIRELDSVLRVPLPGRDWDF